MTREEGRNRGGILVTGGAGFIGARLLRLLVEMAPERPIVNLDALTYAAELERLGPALDAPNLTFVEGDVRDVELLHRAVAEQEIRLVYHLAAETHVDRSIETPATFVSTNVLGTQALLDALRRAWPDPHDDASPEPLLVHVSTDEVFGSLGPDAPPFRESSPYRPSSPYSASKAGADHLVMAAHRTWGFPAIITHSGNNYGPGQHGEKFIPTVIRACLDGAPIPIYGTGRNVRDWIHVDDHVEALVALAGAGRPGDRFMVGARCERSNLQVAREICQLMDEVRPGARPHHDLIRHVTDRRGHDWRYAVDPARTEHLSGWKARRSMPNTLRSLVRQEAGAGM